MSSCRATDAYSVPVDEVVNEAILRSVGSPPELVAAPVGGDDADLEALEKATKRLAAARRLIEWIKADGMGDR